MNLRGQALADHVARELNTDKTATEIAAAAKYTHVERCAQNLARAGYAPIARRLMARHQIDLLNAPETEAEPIKPRTRRPGLTAEEFLDELRDMAACGLTFDEAAERFGVKPHSLQCNVYSKGLTGQVRVLFPGRFRPKISAADLVARLVELAEAGESWEQASESLGYRPASLSKRLRDDGTLPTIRAAFPGHALDRRSTSSAA